MVKIINKIVNDTLKTPQGKFSRKSLTMFVSFIMSILIGSWVVVCNYFTPNPPSEYSVEIFYGFLLLSGGTSVLTVYQKLKGHQQNEEEKE